MPFSTPVQALIADAEGNALRDFWNATPAEWATQHMVRRYNAAPPADDAPDHPYHLCVKHLVFEHQTLRKWFTTEGKLSPLIMGQSLGRLMRARPAGDGITTSWDFQLNGDPCREVLLFKGLLMASWSSVLLLPRKEMGVNQLSALAKTVRSAYQSRAEVAKWPSVDLSRRWIAYRTLATLLRWGVDEAWAWEVSQAQTVFGACDAPSSSSSSGGGGGTPG